MKIGVVGVGQTKFGIINDDIGVLMAKACENLLGSTAIGIENIDIIYISNFSSRFSDQCHLAAVLAQKLGIKKEITRVEAACASGGLAIKEAVLAILSGLYNAVLVVGVEKMSQLPMPESTFVLSSAGSSSERKHGVSFPGLYALMAQHHFYEYKSSEEDLARIAVKNHENAFYNPYAQFKKIITIDDVLKSKTVASPLKLLDCSPISDGAAAVLLCNEIMARHITDSPIYLIGIGHETDYIDLAARESLTTMPAVINAAKKAYQMSGLTPSDIDVAELHDCFTIAELIEMEDLGFCKKGSGKDFIKEGKTKIDGLIPINTSGGLKAKGHPIGATGIAQIIEIYRQLKGEASRQVDGADVGLCCNVGGSGSTSVVSILAR